jgi:hypothetical protein
VPSGTAFKIVPTAQPTSPWQVCTVAAGASGTVTNAAVSNVDVRCVTSTFSIIANVTGLAGGRMQLHDGVDSITTPVAGKNVFPTKIASGGSYAVTIAPQPVGPWQTCTVTSGNASGSVAGADVVVNVACTTNAYSVSVAITSSAPVCAQGTISDGTHSMLVQPPAFNATQTFTLPTLPSGTAYTASFTFAATDSLCVCSYGGPSTANAGNIGSGTIGGGDVSYSITCGDLIP